MYSLATTAQVKDSIANALKVQIENAETNVVKIPLALKLAEHIHKSDVDEARKIALDVQKMMRNTNDGSIYYQKQKAKLFQQLAICDELQDKIVTSLGYLQKAIDIAEAIDDSLSLGKSYRIRGALSIKNKDSITGEKYYRKSIKIRKAINDSAGVAQSYLYLGVFYFYDKKHKDSMPHYMKLAKTYDNSLELRINADANLAGFFMFDQNNV